MEYTDYCSYLTIDSVILTSPEHKDIRRLYRLYIMLGRYYNACILQFNRIEEWAERERAKGSRDIEPPELYDFCSVYTDIHFLLISMELCYQIEGEMYRLLWSKSRKKDFLNQKEVKDVSTMRNALEHMEEHINREEYNETYGLPEKYIADGHSWMEYQLFHVAKGVFTIKNKKLVFSKVMFNHIYEHMWIIINEIQKRVDEIRS